MNKILLFLISLFFVSVSMNAQQDTRSSYFGSPLDTSTLRLSGIYGELRPNHFHAGYDFKTGEKEGMKVLAAADGYISRINISAGGYGKALYITHQNGQTTVYGHLQRFYGELAKYVKAEQYKVKSFTIELYPENNQFKVKKGDVVGFSGNTGSSGGPHLHFEIRDTKTSVPLHPYFWGFKIIDNIPPDLNAFRIYPAEQKSEINGEKLLFQPYLTKSGKEYRLKDSDTVLVKGKVYLGFDATDRMNETNNIFGLYKAEVLVDNEHFYSFCIDSISFEKTRYINSFVDYQEVIQSKDWYQRTWIQPNNRLSIYNNVKDNGILEFYDTKYHTVLLKLYDVSGNVSTLQFYIIPQQMDIAELSEFPVSSFDQKVFKFEVENSFGSDLIKLFLPVDALYDTIHFRYNKSPKIKGLYSSIHNIHHETTPLHKKANLSIKPEFLPPRLKSKACIVRNKANGDLIYAGGKWDNGFLTTTINSFGNYSVSVDTVKPLIRPLNISADKKVSGLKTLRFMISDDFSGISTYNGFLNGKWVLMEYDPKDKLLIYETDGQMLKGKNQFLIEVKDNCGNLSQYKTSLFF